MAVGHWIFYLGWGASMVAMIVLRRRRERQPASAQVWRREVDRRASGRPLGNLVVGLVLGAALILVYKEHWLSALLAAAVVAGWFAVYVVRRRRIAGDGRTLTD